MLCKNCGLRPATTHIKKIINGKVEEYHLCSECAAKLNVSSFDPFDWSEIWGSFFGSKLPPDSGAGQKKCKSCGVSFSEIAKSGRLGCPDCYDTFYDELLPSLRKMHGKTKHVGRAPGAAVEDNTTENEIIDLKSQLDTAIEQENYEQPAVLRDKIRELENAAKEAAGNE